MEGEVEISYQGHWKGFRVRLLPLDGYLMHRCSRDALQLSLENYCISFFVLGVPLHKCGGDPLQFSLERLSYEYWIPVFFREALLLDDRAPWEKHDV